jgi:rubrerythrin
MAKGKITGFGRLFIVLIILAPIAYFGASYLNGEDGVAKLQELINGEKTETTTRDRGESCEDQVLELKEENARLEELVKMKDRELKALREQINGQ